MVIEKMPKAPENDTTAELQNSDLLATDDTQEVHSTSNNPHIEVPVGSLAIQDSFIENQPGEQHFESHRSVADEVAGTERDATVAYDNVVGDDNDNMSEKQLNMAERLDEPADEMVTNMSVQVRSCGQMSVACGEGAGLPEEAQSIKNKPNVKPRSPVLQYSSDAAATGMYVRFC